MNNAILSPHAGRAIRNISGDWRPFAVADRLSDKLKSDIAVEAQRLYDDARAQESRITQIEQEARDTEARIAEADAILAAEIRNECGDPSGIVRATADRDAVRAAAMDPTVWRARLDAARARLVAADDALRSYLDIHALALVAELKPEAERVAKDRATAYAKARKLLEGPEREHNELTATLATVLGRTRPFIADDIPSQRFNEIPYPSAESLEAHRRLIEPEPEPEQTD